MQVCILMFLLWAIRKGELGEQNVETVKQVSEKIRWQPLSTNFIFLVPFKFCFLFFSVLFVYI